MAQLYQHALDSVFDFLSLDDLSRVMAVSPSWWEAIRAMPCARLVTSCSLSRLVPLCSSTLSKHVHRVVDAAKSELTCEALYIVALRMPQLISLQCSILPSQATKLILPHKLETLDLDLRNLTEAPINAIIKGISQLKALVTLRLRLPSLLPAISFAPLAAVESLQDLELVASTVSQPTDAHVDQLRSLPRLRRMAVDKLSNQSLTRLLRTPHSLAWVEIATVDPVDAVASAALAALSSLQVLTAGQCTDIGFLTQLVQLRSLSLHMQHPWPAAITADAVIDGLSCCTQLVELILTAPLNCKHLRVLLPRLPLLVVLWLWHMRELESLECFSSGPIGTQLRALKISHCNNAGLHSSELKHLTGLKALEELVLGRSFVEALTPLELFFLTPPITVMPQLKQLVYTPPSQ